MTSESLAIKDIRFVLAGWNSESELSSTALKHDSQQEVCLKNQHRIESLTGKMATLFELSVEKVTAE